MTKANDMTPAEIEQYRRIALIAKWKPFVQDMKEDRNYLCAQLMENATNMLKDMDYTKIPAVRYLLPLTKIFCERTVLPHLTSCQPLQSHTGRFRYYVIRGSDGGPAPEPKWMNAEDFKKQKEAGLNPRIPEIVIDVKGEDVVANTHLPITASCEGMADFMFISEESEPDGHIEYLDTVVDEVIANHDRCMIGKMRDAATELPGKMDLVDGVVRGAQIVHKESQRCAANWMVVGMEVAARCLGVDSDFEGDVTDLCHAARPTLVGTWRKSFKVIVDPLFPKNQVLMGRGLGHLTELDTDFAWAPYLVWTPQEDPEATKLGVNGRHYAKVLFPKRYVKFTVKDA